MFVKDIHRPIQGVVKFGQESAEVITIELDEYVVTRELGQHFDKFFEGYRKGTKSRTDKMGVWISGFFGSGKSHFLKILSYLLGNDFYDGRKAIDFFEGKIADNRVMADMQIASDTNADVILFNIDSEASADSKLNKDPIVTVFMKVFNKMQGFCSIIPWVADLERQLSNEGQYDDFRARFKEISDNIWEDVRERIYFEQDNVVQALTDTTKMSHESALAWHSNAAKDYALDISTFSRRVREYIEAKEKQTGKKQFVIFLCDEVGQYIGNSSSLILNLQSIVEGLGTECGGRAWVICTAQEDLEAITKVRRDNFSKAIGRFDIQLKLTSHNVDEVIRKRLLSKSDLATEKLRLLYAEKDAILKNLIVFSDAVEKRGYESADEFVDVYPFIPYQFKLLSAVFNGIRTHGASGKHLSEGERSLLNAFQEAALQYTDYEETVLIPFGAFYRTVEISLDHNIRKVILDAEEDARRDTSVLVKGDEEVLKVLFLIKYIPNILPSTLENLATIMLDNINQDKITLKKKIDASLRRLEEQRLITVNGDLFIFLTNEEQDVNREIREISIDHKELIDKVGAVIFDELFGVNKKYRHSDRNDFAFNTIIDDRPLGTQKEDIGIRVLTPYSSYHGKDDSSIRLLSGAERNVIVVLPFNTEFLDEMQQVMQIDAFIRRGSDRTATSSSEMIRATKAEEREQRVTRCRYLVVEALKKAAIYMNTHKLNIREKPPKQRIDDGFKALVDSLYYRLNYITRPFSTIEELKEILTATEDTQITLSGSVNPNHLAITDVQDIIEREYNLNKITTIRTLLEHFCRIPYGWKNIETMGIVLTIFRNQKIRFELNGENILIADINIDYVTKREYLDRLVVKWRVVISPALIANAKEIANEVFGRSDLPNSEDELIARIKEFCAAELSGNSDSIKDLLNEYTSTRYPGKEVLERGKKLFEHIERLKDYKSVYEYLYTEKDELLDYEMDVRDVKNFFKNQRLIFDNALKMLDVYEGNRSYVLDSETKELVAKVDKITKLKSPYSEIRDLLELVNQFNIRYKQLLEDECKSIYDDIETDRDITLIDLGRRTIIDTKDMLENNVRGDFGDLLNRLSQSKNIFAAISMRTESERMMQRYIQGFIEEEIRQYKKDNSSTTTIRKSKTVALKSLMSSTRQIDSEEDVDRLLSHMGAKLKAQLEADTTIHIIN